MGHIPDRLGFFFFHAQRLGDVCHRRILPGCRRGFVLEECQPPDMCLHVCRNVDGAGVLGQGMGDGLADPPGHMGGDAEAGVDVQSVLKVTIETLFKINDL